MSSKSTTKNEHGPQSYPLIESFDNERGQPLRKASGSGEILPEFSPTNKGDTKFSGREDHDTPGQAQWTLVHIPSFRNFLPLDFAKEHPFLLILVRTLETAVWSFTLLVWLKLLYSNIPISKGCIAAGIFVGVVFLKHLTAHLLQVLPGMSSFKSSVQTWVRSKPRLSHFCSSSSRPFDLGGFPYAALFEEHDVKFAQEAWAQRMDPSWYKDVFEYLTYPFSTFRDLYSLPAIFLRTFYASVGAFGFNAAVILLTNSQWRFYPNFSFALIATGATFLQLLLAYLRLKALHLWITSVLIIHLVMLSGPFVLASLASN